MAGRFPAAHADQDGGGAQGWRHRLLWNMILNAMGINVSLLLNLFIDHFSI